MSNKEQAIELALKTFKWAANNPKWRPLCLATCFVIHAGSPSLKYKALAGLAIAPLPFAFVASVALTTYVAAKDIRNIFNYHTLGKHVDRHQKYMEISKIWSRAVDDPTIKSISLQSSRGPSCDHL